MNNTKRKSCRQESTGFSFWRRQRDSNPRGLSPKRFSRPPRYDHFDMPPNLQSIISGIRQSVKKKIPPRSGKAEPAPHLGKPEPSASGAAERERAADWQNGARLL